MEGRDGRAPFPPPFLAVLLLAKKAEQTQFDLDSFVVELEMKLKAQSGARIQTKCVQFHDQRNVCGLALPEVVQKLLREGCLHWDASDSAYVVMDGDLFETR